MTHRGVAVTAPEQAVRRQGRHRECDCPDWVLRCAHWDGQVLWLTWLHGKNPYAGCTAHAWDTPRIVMGKLRTCACGQHPHILCRRGDLINYDTLAEAEAEFFRREALLLGREAP